MANATAKMQSEGQRTEERAVKHQRPWAVIGGLMVAIFTIAGLLVTGEVFRDSTALELIEVMSPPLQMLGFATITATITMLSLILTMLGLINQAELGFGKEFYKLIERISLMATMLLVIAALLMTLLAIPLTEADSHLADPIINFIYYLLILVIAVIVGLLVSAVLMLFDTIKGVIRTLNVEEENPPISS